MVATANPNIQVPNILDAYGRPIPREYGFLRSRESTEREIQNMQAKIRDLLKARFDAAQTFGGNESHWSHADNLDPHGTASIEVRRRLRSRSRYEVIENNPYLKGTVLTIANDFVGSGPKLQITDKRLSKERRKKIEESWQDWFKATKIRKKLWRMRMAKITDGETFMRSYRRPKLETPVELDFQVLEADRISSQGVEERDARNRSGLRENEIDGVRFDPYENPTEYCILTSHPGGSNLFIKPNRKNGDWTKEKFVIHWFRQDRGWLRGIPETTPSLPLCALLRRYTLAIVKHAETAADLTGVIETGKAGEQNPWEGDQKIIDDPFDVIPIEQGLLMVMPKGYGMKQLQAVPLGVQYDTFVGALLREITRPILVPFNVSSGSSKDSNMASAVVDSAIYKSGQKNERIDCEEEVLDKMFLLWWQEAILISGLFSELASINSSFRLIPPRHTWRWDPVTIEHTDPLKVAMALKVLHDKRFITDRDVQEEEMNRDYEDWQDEIKEDDTFRQSLVPPKVLEEGEPPTPAGGNGKSHSRNGSKSTARPQPTRRKVAARSTSRRNASRRSFHKQDGIRVSRNGDMEVVLPV